MKRRKKNSGATTMTYEQAEARKERGVEGLIRLGQEDRADDLEDESVESFAERKKITILNSRGDEKMQTFAKKKKRGAQPPSAVVKRGMARKRNPDTEEAAVELFKTFHGRRPENIREIELRQGNRSNLTGLGRLMYLQLEDGMPINYFDDRKPPIVACDPEGNQIYFLGGQQDLQPLLEQEGIDCSKDLVIVGECQHIIYAADKDFDNFEEKDYQHEFGEDGGDLPVLMFNRLEKQMYLLGGSYTVQRDGIVN